MKTFVSSSEVLILRGLTAEITEKMIFEKIQQLGHIPEYVRIPRDNSKKISKGFALIKFKSLEESTTFLNNNPLIEINDSSFWPEFGFEHSGDDWACTNCRSINFKQRETCFKCYEPRSRKIQASINDGSEDISIQNTRFLLVRNLDESLSAQKIYDKLFLFESNLKRVWLVFDRESQKSQKFAFLEFISEKNAEEFLRRQLNLGIPFKIEANELALSYGRDLSLLSQSLPGTLNGKISYWDNSLEFSEYPDYITIIPEVAPKPDSHHVFGIPAKRTTFGAFPIMSHSMAPPKKIQLQLKNWTEKAKSTNDLEENSTPISFVAEGSLSESKNKFIDTTFLCCLLCDKKFNYESDLMDHAQTSLEHAEKFEQYWKNSVIGHQNDTESYHDRSAERREAFGVNEQKLKKILEEQCISKPQVVNSEESQIDQIPSSVTESVGAKLLKKMGWKEGTGLGKDSSGITEPIKAKTTERSGAGIGASNLISADSFKSKSYNDKVRDNRSKRYKE